MFFSRSVWSRADKVIMKQSTRPFCPGIAIRSNRRAFGMSGAAIGAPGSDAPKVD